MIVVLNNGQTAARAAEECLRRDVHPCDGFVIGIYTGSAETRTQAPETVIKLVLDAWCDIAKRLTGRTRQSDGFTVTRN